VEEEEEDTHILTHGAIRGCGLISMVVCINGKTHNKEEKCDNKEWDLNYEPPFLGAQDIRDWVTYKGWYYGVQCVFYAIVITIMTTFFYEQVYKSVIPIYF